MKKIIVIMLTMFILCGFVYENHKFSELSDNIIRFHIMANSDSIYDQNIKIAIRNKVLDKYKFSFEDIKQAELTIKSLTPEIEEFVNQSLKEMKIDYKAKVFVAPSVFPTKKYGNIFFPAGKYTALKIVLGDGKGKNWWCVMYPPLCFVNNSVGYVDNASKEYLKNNLSKEDYKLIMSDGTKAKVDFKIIEVINNLKKSG